MNDHLGQDGTKRKFPGLLVYVPSLAWNPEDSRGLLDRLKQDSRFIGWEIETYDHRIGYFSRFDAGYAAEELAAQIRIWSGEVSGRPVAEEIILVGHSLGGLLAREALLQDSARPPGSTAGATPWNSRVSRIVLIASPNAGYELHRLKPAPRLLVRLLSIFGRFMFEQLEEGSEYITDLRLRWFEFMTRRGSWAGSTQGRPEVVQVLGTDDRLISEENIRDVGFIHNAVTIKVGGAAHADIVDVSGAPNRDDRYRVLRQAICDDMPELPPLEVESQEPVVFIVHGIRSSKTSEWISTLEGLLKEPVNPLAPSGSDVPNNLDWTSTKVIAPTYGYFGPGNFASPWIRRKNARRMLLWYGEHFITHNPDNMFFIGHSNGTYMLGRSLLNVPTLRFQRIFLAASVLPKDFKWKLVMGRRQVGRFAPESQEWKPGEIHSDRGRRDVPVGLLCSILNGLGNHDIGTGGFDGFDELDSNTMEHRYPGGHGHMLAPRARSGEQQATIESRMREVAAFIRGGVRHTAPPTTEARMFGWLSRILGTATKLWALVLLAIIIAIALGLSVPWYITLVVAALYFGWVVVNNF